MNYVVLSIDLFSLAWNLQWNTQQRARKSNINVFVLELDGGLARAPPIDDKLQHSLSRILRGAMTNLKKWKSSKFNGWDEQIFSSPKRSHECSSLWKFDTKQPKVPSCRNWPICIIFVPGYVQILNQNHFEKPFAYISWASKVKTQNANPKSSPRKSSSWWGLMTDDSEEVRYLIFSEDWWRAFNGFVVR